jgi:hypothetical protein
MSCLCQKSSTVIDVLCPSLTPVRRSEHLFLGEHVFLESPTTLQPHIWHTWLGFVYSARIERGMYSHLRLRRNQGCACGLSCANHPTLKESFNQLVYLQDKHNRYRRYLAHQWWTSFNQRSFRSIFGNFGDMF